MSPDETNSPAANTLAIDAVIVGAGVAGLAAADLLTQRGKRVVVLEARDRVGGRTHSMDLADVSPEVAAKVTPGGAIPPRIDVGGQWLGPGHDTMYAYCERFGIETWPQPQDGEQLVRLRGKSRTYTGRIPKLGPLVLADVGQTQLRFDRLANKVDVDEPWRTPGAKKLDSMTFATWINRTCMTSQGKDFFRIACAAVFATEAANISMLHALFYCKASGSLEKLISTDGGAQQDRIAGGSQTVSDALVAAIDATGMGAVNLNTEVTGIQTTDDGVTVTATTGSWNAKRVIVAVPPTLAGRLKYDPPMSARRDNLTQRMPHGTVIKCHAVYETPFWRADGLSGECAGDEAVVKVIFDATPPGSGVGALLFFIEGSEGLKYSSIAPDVLKADALTAVSQYVGPQALKPIGFHSHNWTAEEFTRGCYGAHLPPGAWTQVGSELRQPVGRIHWAGTETASAWVGYIEGAARSGLRAADEVLAAD